MAPFRGNFPRFEALIAMPGDIVVLFAVSLFRQNHLLKRRLLQAVDGGDTSLWHIKGRLSDLIAYVENPEKTVPKGTEDFFNVF